MDYLEESGIGREKASALSEWNSYCSKLRGIKGVTSTRYLVIDKPSIKTAEGHESA